MSIVDVTPQDAMPDRSNYDLSLERDPSFADLTSAAFKQDNVLANVINRISQPKNLPDPNYDVYNDISGYEGHADRFIGTESQSDAQQIKDRIDQENENKATIAAGGLEGVAASVAAGFVDPTMYIPVGGELWKTYRTGGRILEGAARTAVTMGAITSANELALHSLQETRTPEDSAQNIASATFLGGVMGAAIHGIGGHAAIAELGDRVDRELTVPIDTDRGELTTAGDGTRAGINAPPGTQEPELPATASSGSPAAATEPLLNDQLASGPTGGNSTAGASAVDQSTLSDEALKSAGGLEKLLAFQDPTLRMANSPSKVMRQLNSQLAESPLVKNYNTPNPETGLTRASPVSIENRIKGYNLPKYLYMKEFDKNFLAYRQASSKFATNVGDKIGGLTDQVFGRSRADGMMTEHEFGVEVSKANRRNDEHENPYVSATAKAKRDIILDPMFSEAKRVGLIDQDTEAPKTADSYLNRVWNKPGIEADRRNFQDINEQWLRQKRDIDIGKFEDFKEEHADRLAEIDRIENNPEEGEELNDAQKDLKAQHDELHFRASQDDLDVKNTASQLVDRIMGTPVGRLSYDNKLEPTSGGSGKASVRGPAKARVYDIPDAMVEKYLVNDDHTLTESYVRSLASDIELTKTFGSIDPAEQLKAIQDDYQRLENGIDDPKALRLLRKAKNNDLRDFDGVWQRLRGTYGSGGGDDYANPLRTAERLAMNMNYMANLGGMTISAFTDVGRPVMIHGFKATMGDGIMAALGDWKNFRAATNDVKEAATGLDMVLNTRGKALMGIDEYQPFMNKAEAVTGHMMHNFGIVSLMAPWNAAAKQFAGVMTQSRMLRAINKIAGGLEVKPKELEYLAANFVDRDMANRIADQFQKYGKKTDSVHIPNARLWDDIEAKDTFRAAVRRDVDRTIVEPGQDKPLWMSKPGLKVLGQFRSFSIASTQRTTLAALQQRDAAAFNGSILSMVLGAGVYVLKSKGAGIEPNYDSGNLLAEGFDRSGLGAWMMDASNIAEKVSRGRIGLHAMLGGPPMSRYASRSALESIFGPTYGMIGNLVQLAGNGFAGDWQAADTHTIRRLMPYQNLFYLRSIFDEAEKNINDGLGVPNKQQ